jgi:hypothetical protein
MSAFLLPYLWGLVAPPTTGEKGDMARLEHHLDDIERLVKNQDKNPQDLTKFFDELRLPTIYPLAYALFYSGGTKEKTYSAIVNSGNVAFDPGRIKVDKISDNQLCISGFSITADHRTMAMDDVCFNTAPGYVRHLISLPHIMVDILSLGGSIDGAAWIIGVR